ncbi:MAG TPA: hypothetical protein VGY55_15700 [Pirellulales bacterium]|jgi:hypothetical protein|nr:hypothetical protein [Pirellulales bacterium]
MRRSAPETVETSGQDSFVDVVTNLVGIMIVLVIIVGVRVKHVWVDPGDGKPRPAGATHADPDAALTSLQSKEVEIEGDLHREAQQVALVEQELAARSNEREQLAARLAVGERELAGRRSHLESGSRTDFDLQQQLAALQRQLAENQQEVVRAENDRPPPVEMKHYLTPISRTVFGKEVHFRLSQGRIAYVPLEELLDEAKSSIQKELAETRSPTALTEHEQSIGPYAGFEMLYAVAIKSAGTGRVELGFREIQIVPVAGEPGETLSDALRPTSEFRRRLAEHDPSQSTATIWVYPDGFADFRTIREELYRLGFATAARPLPLGMNITGSDHGSHSAAQ